MEGRDGAGAHACPQKDYHWAVRLLVLHRSDLLGNEPLRYHLQVLTAAGVPVIFKFGSETLKLRYATNVIT